MYLTVQNLKFNNKYECPRKKGIYSGVVSSPALSGSSSKVYCPQYYHPNFTSRRDISDDEFAVRLSKLKDALLSFNSIPQKNVGYAIDYTTKDNIKIAERLAKDDYNFITGKNIKILKAVNDENNDFAEKVLFDRTLLGCRDLSSFAEIIPLVNSDNAEFAEMLYKNKRIPSAKLPTMLEGVDKSTLPFVRDLYINSPSGIYNQDVVFKYKTDKVAAISHLLMDDLISDTDNYGELISKMAGEYENLPMILDYINSSTSDTKSLSFSVFEQLTELTLPIVEYFAKNQLDLLSMTLAMQNCNNQNTYWQSKDLSKLISVVDTVVSNNKNSNIDRSEFLDNVLSFSKLLVAASIFDKESLDIIVDSNTGLRCQVLDKLSVMPPDDLNLLKNLIECKTLDGAKLKPKDKISLVSILYAYNRCQYDKQIISNMADNGIIDLNLIKDKLFVNVLLRAGLSNSDLLKIKNDKLYSWNLDYIHNLYEELSNPMNSKPFNDVIFAYSTSEFLDYIHDFRNIYGEANNVTARRFDEYGLDYLKWLRPPKTCAVRIHTNDVNKEQLSQVVRDINFEMDSLRHIDHHLKNYIDKRFSYCIEDDKFLLPKKYYSNPKALKMFLNNLFNQMDKVWARALKSANDDYMQTDIRFDSDVLPDSGLLTEQEILQLQSKVKKNINSSYINTVRTHIIQHIDDIDVILSSPKEKQIDWTVKMWKRNPQHDLFQGNYSTCCIGLGKSNGKFMPYYLLNTAFNMIEIVDNTSGETVGNALCYFVCTDSGNPALVIDNIEIKNSEKPSDNTGLIIRDAIFKYAKNLAKEIAADDNIQIILGGKFNDVPIKNLDTNKSHVSFIGDVSANSIYLDLFGGTMYKHMLYGKDVSYCRV